ncbi:hypothetical protein NEPAR06_2289 [Nematocida parisii]|uniref:Endoplasmic reticulum transmembrane protein n=1 Tax=Nematocida parisii (strain ERTm3) TaxID=935791 RepID=I3EHS1_NEMP3|nr:uncharacterized protein NEPG_02368 [Nematocida parisii ERTm1]EIJ88768.1 hypothetical protein NEQG_00587 [Nematocida parisii ERTm3]KAI5125778.1 hypothetical protein NEPAR03_0215 [Nematocida parisii]EIJ92677.1 hypothetical protein NEPG_02368 [Nematocida parisii ERTm1]KAI5126723.1 hypothetical protein NEPAR08_0575 [Nematocida parisii]KAI5140911.1 hypothetical protein NEPAR04_0572 [Nematocida parisii]|eukprot:XP_013060195.1 hypothetical protein NEPG_02368 [Nematocida parisii ERTm1]
MLLQLCVVILLFYLAHQINKNQEEAEKIKALEKKVADLMNDLDKYKGYERNYNNLKKSYLDLLDKTVSSRKKGE